MPFDRREHKLCIHFFLLWVIYLQGYKHFGVNSKVKLHMSIVFQNTESVRLSNCKFVSSFCLHSVSKIKFKKIMQYFFLFFFYFSCCQKGASYIFPVLTKKLLPFKDSFLITFKSPQSPSANERKKLKGPMKNFKQKIIDRKKNNKSLVWRFS